MNSWWAFVALWFYVVGVLHCYMTIGANSKLVKALFVLGWPILIPLGMMDVKEKK